jgi:PTS system N-acetylglucosamine-specific IIC component
MAEVKTTSSEQGAKTNKIVKAKRSERKAKGGTTAWSKFLTLLQELGKTLQFPIAMLPFAAILNRFGALGIQYTSETVDGSLHITNEVGYWISFIIQKPGGVAFDNLPLMFAIGVAFGLAKDHRGEVALVGALFYLILAAMTGSCRDITWNDLQKCLNIYHAVMRHTLRSWLTMFKHVRWST